MAIRNIQRYPELAHNTPSIDNEDVETTVNNVWAELQRWVGSLILALEQDQSFKVFNVTIDNNKSINIEGRIKVADTDSSITALEGDIRYNSSTNKHQGYNGTTWNDMY